MARLGRFSIALTVVLVGTVSPPAFAEEQGRRDDYFVEGRMQAHLLLFRSASAPGPGGAVVRRETHVPIVQYVSVSAFSLDTSFGEDTCDVELALWKGVELGDPNSTDRLQGDVQTASITLHTTRQARRAWVRLGRQVEAGGAARFTRFDGVSAGISLVPELTLSAYGGMMVLPRWDRRPGYYHLGSAADSLLRSPEAFEESGRTTYGVIGGKVSFDDHSFHAALSFHEQRDQGQLGRRNLGFDAGAPIGEYGFVGLSTILDLDALRPSTARLFANVWLGQLVDLGVEYLKADPALLLSRQSVLSVFGTSGYQEAGGSIGVRPARMLRLTSSAYAQFYDDSPPGGRLDASARLTTAEGPSATVMMAGFGRVVAQSQGYYSGRLAVNQPLPWDLTATMQGYAYFYDEKIEGYQHSLTGSLSMAYAIADSWQLLWAGVISRSPYAALDASTQLRLTYQFSLSDEGASW